MTTAFIGAAFGQRGEQTLVLLAGEDRKGDRENQMDRDARGQPRFPAVSDLLATLESIGRAATGHSGPFPVLPGLFLLVADHDAIDEGDAGKVRFQALAVELGHDCRYRSESRSPFFTGHVEAASQAGLLFWHDFDVGVTAGRSGR